MFLAILWFELCKYYLLGDKVICAFKKKKFLWSWQSKHDMWSWKTKMDGGKELNWVGCKMWTRN
jgi:hypothetical protein